MPNRRKKAIKGASQEEAGRGLGRYRYVDLAKLERFGISEFKPEAEYNYMAIIPMNDEAHVDDDDLPMFCREIYVHTYIGVNTLTFLCTKQMSDHFSEEKWNEPCAVCEYIQRLRQTHPDSPLIKEMKADLRYLFFLVDVSRFERGATTKQMEDARLKVQWWNATSAVRGGVVQASSDPRSGEPEYDVADPDDGKTIIFFRTSEKKYKCLNFRIEERNGIPYEWLDQVPFEFDDILKIPRYEDVKAEVEGIPADAKAGTTQETGNRRRRSERGSDESKGGSEPSEKSRGRGRRRSEEPVETDKPVEEKQQEPVGRGSGRRRRSEPVEEKTESPDSVGEKTEPAVDKRTEPVVDKEPEPEREPESAELDAEGGEMSAIDKIRAKIKARQEG
jgi:hypothetical protein